MKLPVFLLGAFGLLLAGCTSVTVQRPPTFNPARYQHIFVERPFNENHHVDEIIVNELKAQGRDATSGPLTMLPDNADAIVSYESRWTWDFHTYLIELDVSLRTARTNKRLAAARYFQPSARTLSAPEVVHALITRMFAPNPAAPKK